MESEGLICGSDGQWRCWWHGNDPLYLKYHDEEWGFPVADDRRLFEKLCLEGFQAGLSWLTILRKRENFRAAFNHFEYEKIAHYTDDDVRRLLENAGIIRHRGKIEAVINNARKVPDILKAYGSLASYFWQFQPGPRSRPEYFDYPNVKALTKVDESAALSRDLKKRGFKFVGATTMYALMQSVGMVNDHIEGCIMREAVASAQARFKRPL